MKYETDLNGSISVVTQLQLIILAYFLVDSRTFIFAQNRRCCCGASATHVDESRCWNS